MLPKDRIICALDVDTAACAIRLVEQLRGSVGVFKVGLELLSCQGIQIVDVLREAGADRVFLDAKLHDIPNTVAGAMRGVVRAGAWCVTVHASGGKEMLRSAVRAAHEESEAKCIPRPKILAVTLLTSIGEEVLHGEMHADLPLQDYVTTMAEMALDAGCDGVISSPQEIQAIRAAIPDPRFLIVTPGVRPAAFASGDQARVTTPREAIERGASYLVIGRPIVAAADPVEAARRIVDEISAP